MSKDISILIVDDEEPIRRLLSVYLSDAYTCVTASSADEAAALISSSFFNLVLTDITMPGASGLELCQLIQKTSPETVTVMVSGMTDIQYAIEAMRQGAFDYITKPFDLQQVLMAVDRALRYQALVAAKRHYELSLEQTVRERTKELRSLNQDLNGMLEALYTNYRATLRALAGALEARDVETRGHSDRVVAYCLRLGRELGLSHNDLISLEQGALLHDIGKIGVPDQILLKQGELSAEEWTEMRKHIQHGLRIINGIDFLSGARPVVGQHHEKFDGSGYPLGLSGEAIHIHARIFAVADAFDAITSDRPYRAASDYSVAREEIIKHSGTHFDPRVVKAFLVVPQAEWNDIRLTADSQDYVEQIIDRREIRSFIVSLKRHTGTTGQLNRAFA
ncbi:MAG TPA: HD domain-containing phosphohydrolase [Blastocatellia bacterium]|nr:HD domain-containing phosphohydrolase [Blastocatellia bacterium]